MSKKQRFPHLVGSKWTACAKVEGWRHFEVVNRKNQGQWVFAEIVASCDSNVRLWVNARALKNRSLWTPGWSTLTEMRNETEVM
ncbi:MAG: TIGR02450 family Trp-rich protein [Elainellaceae cyanobacterium]